MLAPYELNRMFFITIQTFCVAILTNIPGYIISVVIELCLFIIYLFCEWMIEHEYSALNIWWMLFYWLFFSKLHTSDCSYYVITNFFYLVFTLCLSCAILAIYCFSVNGTQVYNFPNNVIMMLWYCIRQAVHFAVVCWK